MDKIFGEHLYYKQDLGQKQVERIPTIQILQRSNIICLYFAAKWSKASQKLTPIIMRFYNDVNQKDAKLYEYQVFNKEKESVHQEELFQNKQEIDMQQEEINKQQLQIAKTIAQFRLRKKTVKMKQIQSKNMEIIYVSLDEDEESF